MRVQSADPAVTARGPGRQLPWPLSSYLAGFVAGFVLAAGAGLGVISGAGRLSGGLPVIALAGLLVAAAASMMFYRRISRPIVELNAQVQEAMTNPSAGPLTVTGPAGMTSLARDINTMIETARDISERARLEAERRAIERRQQQSERLESLGQLTGGIAHDLNNLLGVIINYAGFAAEVSADRPAVRGDLEQIQAAAERAALITGQLLIAGRRDTGQPELLGLNAIIAENRPLLATALGAGIEIRVDTAGCLPAIEADRGQVEQLLLNLAAAARDAMPEGGTLIIETGIVEFSERLARAHPGVRPGRYAEIVVSDTGNGMSADIAERISGPLVANQPTGQGTGPGPAAVHGIVTRAGGSITVESEPGIGTTFRILFPAAAAVPAQPVAHVPQARGSGPTILVVDDEPAALELTSRILRQNGYATLDAGTFEEALSLASGQDLQLLLTDSVMPRMSGPALAEQIDKMKPGVPVLYMSGQSPQTLSQPASADLARYIQKPFTPQDLLEKVHSVLSTAPRPRAGS